jgi:hypothetical protein
MQVLQETTQDLDHLRLGASADRPDYRPKELVDEGNRDLPEVSIRKVCRKVREELTTPSPMEVQRGLSKTAMMLKEPEVLIEQCLKRRSIGRHDASFPAHAEQGQRLT